MNPRRSPLPTDVGSLPDLPPAFDERLSAGLGALGIEPDGVARVGLRDHVRLLLAWNESINLTSIRDPVAAATGHVVDSLTAVPILRSEGVDSFVDIGSGGGFPGIPLALALPNVRGHLIESIGKKAKFLETAVAALGLVGRVTISRTRAEDVARDATARRRWWRAVVVRAVAPLPELVELALPLLQIDGLLIAWKRLPLDDEIEAGQAVLAALGGGDAAVHHIEAGGLEGHVLVVARKVRRTPSGYPRDPRVRKRRPTARTGPRARARDTTLRP